MKKRFIKSMACSAICISLAAGNISVYAAPNQTNAAAESQDENNEEKSGNSSSVNGMTDKQLSSISMLNYLSVLTQEINVSSNSKVFLDNAYSSLVNNTNPNAVDADSLSEIQSLLNTIDGYKSIKTKRERLKYMYEQNQASAAKKAIPNPMAVLNLVQSKSIMKTMTSIVYLAVDSKNSYESYITETENKYLEDGWQLDDSAVENLSDSRKAAFNYMVEMCRKNDLDGKLALNEKAVSNFAKWEREENVDRRIDFFEDNESTYKAYGKYWLVLAAGYYEQGEYEKCLEAINTYHEMHIDTFRCDKEYAKALALAIPSIQELYSGSKYIAAVENCVEEMRNNIEIDDWALRYMAAQTYVDLYARTKDTDQEKATRYLREAFELADENVNYLMDVQYAKNNEYLEDIEEIKVKKTDSKEKKTEIKNFNKWQKEERKVELPPVYQPLVANCDLLFAIADELQLSDKEKSKINNKLHTVNKPLFLVKQLDDLYWFDTVPESEALEIAFSGKRVEIPAKYLAMGSTVSVSVKQDGTTTSYDDWVVKEVDRNKSNSIDDFVVTYESPTIKQQKYNDSAVVKVTVSPGEEGGNYETLTCSFNAKTTKKIFGLTEDTEFEKAS